MNKGMGDFTLNLFNPNQLLRNINRFSNLLFFTGITVLTIGFYFALIVAPSDYQQGVSCPKCINKKSIEQRKRYSERQKQITITPIIF